MENIIRGGISSVIGDRYVKSDDKRKVFYTDATNLYGHPMSQPLPYDEIKFDKNVKLEDILISPDESDIGYFVEVDLSYPDNIKQKRKHFPFAPEHRKIIPDDFSYFLKKIKPDNYTQTEKLICNFSDKKNYLIPYRILKFHVGHCMIVEKVHSVISFKQDKWLEKYIFFDTQKRDQAVNDFKKGFYKLLNNAFYGKTRGNVRNRLILECIKKDDADKFIKQQSKLTFNGILKSLNQIKIMIVMRSNKTKYYWINQFT